MSDWRLPTAPFRLSGIGYRLSAVLIQLPHPDQHLSRLRTIGRAEDPGLMQLINDPRRATIANPELPLEQPG